MRFIDLLRLIMDNLGRRKGRVMLTAIGVVIGTASVILLISLAIGLQKSATSNLWGISDLRRIDVYPGYSEVPMGMAVSVDSKTGMPSGMQLLTPQTVEDIKAIPGVEMVTPRQTLYGQAVLKSGRLENYAWIQGVAVCSNTRCNPASPRWRAGRRLLAAGRLNSFMIPNSVPVRTRRCSRMCRIRPYGWCLPNGPMRA